MGKTKGIKKGPAGGKGGGGKGGTADLRHLLAKKLTWILRHGAAEAKVQIDHQGWVDVEELLRSPHMSSCSANLQSIRRIVETCAKKRFELKDDDSEQVWIRATVGHSISQKARSALKGPLTGLLAGRDGSDCGISEPCEPAANERGSPWIGPGQGSD